MTASLTERRMLLIATVISIILSGLSPKDRLTWFLEIVPVLIGIPILVAHTHDSLLRRCFIDYLPGTQSSS